MRTNLTRIGNSWGIRIPKPFLEQAGLGGTSPRQGWEEAFAAVAEDGDDGVLLDKIDNAFDRDEWTW
jgi:antitoxin MazE